MCRLRTQTGDGKRAIRKELDKILFKVYDMSDLEMEKGCLLCCSSTVKGCCCCCCWCCCCGREMLVTASYTLDDGCSLRVELVGVGIVAFLLAL